MTSDETLHRILNAGEPWGLLSVLSTLARAAEHLLREHDCDVEGHEEFDAAARAAREILRGFDEVPWPRGEVTAPERLIAALQSSLAHMVERMAKPVRPRHGFLSREETMRLVWAWEGHGGAGRAPVLCWGRSAGDVRLLWVSVDERVRDAVRPDDLRWLIADVLHVADITRSLAVWPEGVESWLRGPGAPPPYDPKGAAATAEEAAGLLHEAEQDGAGGAWSYSIRTRVEAGATREYSALTVCDTYGDQERERLILSAANDPKPSVMHLASYAPDLARSLVQKEHELRARDALIAAQAQEIVAWRLAMDEAMRDLPVNVHAPGTEGAKLAMALVRARREVDVWRARALAAEMQPHGESIL